MSQPRKIQIEDATIEQLRQFAAENLGMTFGPKVGIKKVTAGLRQAWRQSHIILYNDDEAEQPEVVVEDKGISTTIRALKGGSCKNDPVVKMYINEAEGAGGTRSVWVSVNNVGILLPRGEEFDCPYRYYLALKAAVMAVHEQDENTYEIFSRNVPAYPFQVSQLPTLDEMKPWRLQEILLQFHPGKHKELRAIFNDLPLEEWDDEFDRQAEAAYELAEEDKLKREAAA